ncbi:MAG TPA: flavin reductase family protein [Bryobacteraceae bacterium]|nr:flavin reductase family protein [Bryobacteraceae bacterium]
MSSSPSLRLAGSGAVLDPQSFRDACALFAAGVAVATVTAPDGTPQGLTVSSFTSVSVDPSLVLICIDLKCPQVSYFRQGTHFAVNILTESQRDVSIAFAEKLAGRFDGIEWSSGRTGAPVLDRCLAVLECRTASILEAGDHAVFVGQVENVESRGGQPLLYFNRDYRRLG